MTSASDAGEPNDSEPAAAATPAAEFIAAERLVFFSDAVVAIAITLLAFILPAPASVGKFVSDATTYIDFLISFAVIGGHWRAHYRLYRDVTRLDQRQITLSLIWLFMVVITPYATRLLSDNGNSGTHASIAFGIYALIQVLTIVTFALMLRHIVEAKLTRPGAPQPASAGRLAGVLALAGMFAISIPLVFAIGQWAYLCWVASPVVGRLVQHRFVESHSGGT
jgi:uncharacterized membrane protein